MHRHAPVWSKKCDVNLRLLAARWPNGFHTPKSAHGAIPTLVGAQQRQLVVHHFFRFHWVFTLQPPVATPQHDQLLTRPTFNLPIRRLILNRRHLHLQTESRAALVLDSPPELAVAGRAPTSTGSRSKIMRATARARRNFIGFPWVASIASFTSADFSADKGDVVQRTRRISPKSPDVLQRRPCLANVH